MNGLRDYKKRRKIFNWCCKHKGDGGLIFIQETHSDANSEKLWKHQWRGQMFCSHGTTQSKGTMILVGQHVPLNVQSIDIDDQGRYVLLECTIDDLSFLMLNTYAPNCEREQEIFFKLIETVIEKYEYEEKSIIWGGDFNCSFSKHLDTDGGNYRPKVNSL